jgi:uncharacterized protein (TIGR01777 family)
VNVLLAGGSGFLGRALASRLARDGHTVSTLTRRPREGSTTDIAWQPDGGVGAWARAVSDADVIFNLAGESIGGRRWSESRKRELRDSRVRPTRSLARALAEGERRPRIFVTNTAIGIYGAHGDEPVTEDAAAGDDFLAKVAVDWEREAAQAASALTTVALVRTGIVLHPAGGALKEMLLPFKFGVGGPMGSGRQYMAWIHLDDWVRMVLHLAGVQGAGVPRASVPGAGVSASAAKPLRRDLGEAPPPRSASEGGPGAVEAVPIVWNATAPNPVTNAEFARTLGRVLRRPAFLPAPGFALRLLLGEFADFVLTGARVLPARAEAAGFRFRFPELEPALRDLLPGSR